MRERSLVVKYLIILLSGLLMFSLSGCGENKNSREWIENKVSEVSRVYPTADLFDLFEEFPEGFEVSSTARYEKQLGASFYQEIELFGNLATKEIKGTVKNIKTESNPYRETVLLETEVTYTTDGYIFSNSDFSEDDLIYKGFLFQRLSLNKEVLSNLKLKDKGYAISTGDASITYMISGPEIVNFFGIPEGENLELYIGARSASLLGNYYLYPLTFKGDNLDYYNESVWGFGGNAND